MATKMPPGLNKKAIRKALIMEYMERYIKKNGRPPSQREIAVAIGFSDSSWGTVSIYMKELAREGKLRKLDGRHGYTLAPIKPVKST